MAAGDTYITCDNNMPTDLLFRSMVVKDSEGNPALRTYETNASGGGSGGDASAANQVLQTAALNSLIAESSDSILDKRFPTSAPLLATKQGVSDGSRKLMGFNFINSNTTAVFIKFYNNVLASTTPGTDIPVLTICIPPGNGSSPGFIYQEANAIQHIFSLGMVVIATTDITDLGITAPATGIIGNVKYK